MTGHEINGEASRRPISQPVPEDVASLAGGREGTPEVRGRRRLQRPDAEPFANDTDREEWREHIEEGWRWRIANARASAEIAGCILPYLTANSLTPWASDFLTVILINSLDRVVLTGIDVLCRRKDVHSFEALKEDLNRRCQGASLPSWRAYLDAAVTEARSSETFKRAKLARDRLIAHSSQNPLEGVTGYQDLRLTMKEILKLQDLIEEVLARFPEGLSWGARPVFATEYANLVGRIVEGEI
jgi:hypothetical protein